ncbi:hypothetical protein N1030_16500 [Desulfovibrio mangrovi]|uniref:hypothetical protein n=1 Tax=Desulfovibrio mangrovi TaxID=2976983 RepID=UPI0022472E9F|nr:hypothetical protein [Desulfovibrio mangrovi]UZP67176.1 hypothetical protein N1030_16500 [Desulfovibrio mangrovi]
MNEKYSVLFMRDDTKVHRFRISPMWLKLLIWLQLILVITASLGFYAGYNYWKQNAALQSERIDLQRELRATQVQLERLENIEQILQSNDPEELQALFGTMSIEDSSKEKPSVDLSALLATEDVQLVSVENVMLKPADDATIRVSFDINNLDASKTIDGIAVLSLIGRDGQIFPINADSKDLKFTISRFKKVVASFSPPETMALKDMYALRIAISAENKTVLKDLFPIESILQ